MGITAITSRNDLKSDPASAEALVFRRGKSAFALGGPYLLGISASFVITNPTRIGKNREANLVDVLHFSTFSSEKRFFEENAHFFNLFEKSNVRFSNNRYW